MVVKNVSPSAVASPLFSEPSMADDVTATEQIVTQQISINCAMYTEYSVKRCKELREDNIVEHWEEIECSIELEP